MAACRIFIGKDVMPTEVFCWADTLEHDVPFEGNARRIGLRTTVWAKLRLGGSTTEAWMCGLRYTGLTG